MEHQAPVGWERGSIGDMGPLRRCACMVLVLPLAACAGGWGWAEEATLRPIKEVLSLPAAELAAGVPVRVRGVVVLTRPIVVVQDGACGIWAHAKHYAPFAVDLPSGGQREIGLGDEVEVEGVVDRGGFAPTIKGATFRLLGTKPLPPPIPADLGRLFRGGDNAVRVEFGETLDAIVQGCREDRTGWNLVLDVATRRIMARIEKTALAERPEHLIDARVKLVGVVGSTRNSRGQFLAPTLNVAAADDITVLEPSPSSPFAAPLVPLAAIATYRPEPVARHRIQTEGIVTCHVPGRYCYLQEGLVGLRVECPAAVDLRPGDVVRAAGFVDMSRMIAGIVEGVVEKTGRAAVPEPAAIAPEEIGDILSTAERTQRIALPTNYAGVLIRFPARLVERRRFRDGWMLTLGRGQTSSQAWIPVVAAGDAAALEGLQPGGDVEVTGVARVDAELPADYVPTGRNPEIRPVELVLRSAADVRVVRAASWWTPRRLGTALAAAGVLLAAVLGWVGALRRELALQFERVAHEIRSRRESEVEFEATLRERNRLAANLHDTLLQTIGGIRYQLDACRVAGREKDEAEADEHFDVARRMIDHVADEVRGSVWALRTMPMPGKSFTDSIAVVVGQFEKQLGKGHGPRISFQTTGGALELPNFVAGNLLLVVQEAIHNAIRHGRPTRIDVDADFSADGSLALTIRDDGMGFEPGTEAGPAQGHFGLQGMRERLERLGGTITIESAPGAGTTITGVVAAAAAAQP